MRLKESGEYGIGRICSRHRRIASSLNSIHPGRDADRGATRKKCIGEFLEHGDQNKHKLKGAEVDTCASGTLTPMMMPPVGAPLDLEVTGPCTVPAGNYYYGNVNIFKKKGATTGGILSFNDATIDFWANSILVENAGTLRAGVAADGKTVTYRHREHS